MTATPAGRLPNIVYIGPDKAGSSWLHTMLDHHRQVYVTEAKDLYFFDRFYDGGPGGTPGSSSAPPSSTALSARSAPTTSPAPRHRRGCSR